VSHLDAVTALGCVVLLTTPARRRML